MSGAAWGMLLALRERDLKRILAWSTVATLGTLVTLVGLRGEGASVAVGALLLAYALYKAPLFFVAGNIDHGTGTRNIDHLGDLHRAMPWTAAVALLAGAIVACTLHDRLVMLLVAGLVGYGSGLLFLFAGAPDVAYTQFTVETVFVIVVASVLLALRRDRRTVSLVEPLWRPWALLIAVAFGAVITLVLLLALAAPFDPSLSQFFAERSVPEAYGRNVVNVILVDFRALDTLGEITVVMLSLVAALPLLQVLRKRARAGEHE